MVRLPLRKHVLQFKQAGTVLFHSGALVSALACALALPAQAAETAAAAKDRPKSNEATQRNTNTVQLEERIATVTVFGRAIEDTVRDVPQTLSVFTPEFTFNAGAVDFHNVLRFVPTSASRYSEIGFYPGESVIRGFASSRTINGLGLDTMNHGADLVNAERIEVLMGPASVLYGSMQPGAVVNVVTKRPKDQFHFEMDAGFGSYNDQRYSVDVGGPLSDSVRVRLNAAYRDRESFLDYWSLNKISVAPVMEVDVSDKTLLTLEGFYSRNDWGAGTWLGGPPEGLLTPNPNGNYRRSFFPANPDADEGVGTVRQSGRFDATLRHDFSDTLSARMAVSYTYGQSDDADIIPFGFVNNDFRTVQRLYFFGLDSRNDDYSYYLDVAGELMTGPIRHRYSVGAEYRTQKEDNSKGRGARLASPVDLFNPVYNATLPNPLVLNATEIDTETRGIFLQDRMSIGERLHLIAGVRYAEVDVSNVFTPAGGTPAAPDKLSQDAWPTQFGVVFDVTDSVSLFANRAESFLPRSGTTAGAKPFPPEEGNQIEAGAKFDLGNSGLIGNLALFQVEKPDVLAPDPQNFGSLALLGAVKSQGIELSVNGSLTADWTLYAAYAYMTTDVESSDTDLDGNELPNAPENTFSLMTRYDIPGGPLTGLGFSAAVQYSAGRFAEEANSIWLPSHTRLDLGVYYEINDHVDVSLLVNNATDEDIWSGFSPNWISIDLPRTYVGRVRYRL
jgi:iron complex outermembrane recepter protein